eukprot:scaffold14.g1035.t1
MQLDSRHVFPFVAGAALGAGAVWLCSRHLDGLPGRRSAFAAAAGLEAAAAARPSPQQQQPASLADFEADEVLAEQLTRNVQFFGLEGQRRIASSFVVVVGLGGVGSHAAHLLLRSGVGRLRIIDFDQARGQPALGRACGGYCERVPPALGRACNWPRLWVSLSSLNRHCLATREDVGTPKATCLARHFADILPEAAVEALVEMYTEEAEVALLAACRRRGLRVLSVAGAGAKADPTRLHIADIAESAVDPLARAVRHRLRRDHGVESGVPVVLSTERPRCGLIYAGEEVVPNFRVRTIPVLGTTPAIFGLAAAAHVLCALAGAPFEGAPLFYVPTKQFAGIHAALYEREELRFGSADGVGVDAQEVEALVREVWRGRSARAAPGQGPGDKALKRSVGHLTLTRWDAARPATVDNLVLLTHEEADAHDAGPAWDLPALRAMEPELCTRVEAALARAAAEFGWRLH